MTVALIAITRRMYGFTTAVPDEGLSCLIDDHRNWGTGRDKLNRIIQVHSTFVEACYQLQFDALTGHRYTYMDPRWCKVNMQVQHSRTKPRLTASNYGLQGLNTQLPIWETPALVR